MTNKEFKKLPASEKRVVIAQDIIDQINLGIYIAKRGGYIQLPYSFAKKNEGLPLQPFLQENKVKCKVCGIGACFLSLVKFENEFDIEDNPFQGEFGYSWNKPRRRIRKYFGEKLNIIIECIFEKSDMFNYQGLIKSEDMDKYVAFGKSYKSNNKRLLAIMQNIVDNEGKFILK